MCGYDARNNKIPPASSRKGTMQWPAPLLAASKLRGDFKMGACKKPPTILLKLQTQHDRTKKSVFCVTTRQRRQLSDLLRSALPDLNPAVPKCQIRFKGKHLNTLVASQSSEPNPEGKCRGPSCARVLSWPANAQGLGAVHHCNGLRGGSNVDLKAVAAP